MGEINWNLLQPVDTGALTMQGFQTGMGLVKRAQTQHALRNYLANPDDPQAYNALAAFDMDAAGQIQRQQMLRRREEMAIAEEARRKELFGQYAGGDTQGARQGALAGGDIDLYKALNDLDADSRQKAVGFYKTAGPLAYQMLQTNDPAQRKALLDAARPMLEAQGADPKLIDGFDVTNDTALNAFVTANSTVDDLINRGKVQWHQVGEFGQYATDYMGRPVGSKNPFAAGGNGQPPPPPTKPGPKPAEVGPPDLAAAAAIGSQFGQVTSTKRSPAHNKKVGGVANSYHLTGRAIDIARAPGVSHADVEAGYRQAGFQILESLDEGDHSHIALGGGPGAAVKVGSKSEFDKLASGTVFIAPDGSRRVKP